MPSPELSEKSRAILEAIAEGHSYEQILSTRIAHTYNDIFRAAAEALDIAHQFKPGKTYDERMQEIQAEHPRAYGKWSDDEDAQLSNLFRAGRTAGQIAAVLQRHPGAIRSRLAKLNLVERKTD